ncbi:hypothetical protein H310_11173 [Aphanomyces invadans]|uniref:Uncharacterized protein n=1 Tax=Aphanomyces invadans TaxID=157072 RepID=A0A024TNR4_9STRA|nr:hypothetical protein H310_11173 [Aphanomyces invadans]ETV95271.1 hypothetical protein H310_11173 [Aphanomyces invadans]|eukprot:XP_008875972.1 hypothetical protein H310_11173 [Aphanomyces invadans]
MDPSLSQAAQSRGVGGRLHSDVRDPQVEEMALPSVGYTKDRYDPDHPDADWGGVVNRTFKKRTFQDHVPTRSHLTPSKGGLFPAIDAPTTLRTTSKRIYDRDIKFVSNDADARDTPFRTGVHQVGPGGRHDCSDWKTSYAAQSNHNQGSHEEKNAPGKVKLLGHDSHRRQLQPLFEVQNKNRSDVLPKLPTEPSSRNSSTMKVEPRRGMCFLSGIGKSLASFDTLQDIKRPTPHIQSGFDNPADKTLLVENHHNVLLGYTGQRRDK